MYRGIQNVDINNGNFQKFLEVLAHHHYNVDFGVIPALWFGVPQTRERFVLLASKHTNIKLPSQTHDGLKLRMQLSETGSADYLLLLPVKLIKMLWIIQQPNYLI